MNLVVYGSLMRKQELRQAGFSMKDALPVTVEGYTRRFDQMPSWRKGAGRNVAVLSAREDRERRMNAVLLLDFSVDLASVDHRERGYERRRLEGESLFRHADGQPLRPAGDCYIYVGKPDLRGEDVLPNREYLQRCLEGAREWGEAFYEDFLKTTFVCGIGVLGDHVGESRPPHPGPLTRHSL